jgi:hypothetical protein
MIDFLDFDLSAFFSLEIHFPGRSCYEWWYVIKGDMLKTLASSIWLSGACRYNGEKELEMPLCIIQPISQL